MSRRRSSLRIQNNPGMLVLAIWLILTGAVVFAPSLNGLRQYFPLLALLAGVLILVGR
ncbi:MAG: hypothetical protein ACM3JD_08170 [Rudaea sp.]